MHMDDLEVYKISHVE